MHDYSTGIELEPFLKIVNHQPLTLSPQFLCMNPLQQSLNNSDNYCGYYESTSSLPGPILLKNC